MFFDVPSPLASVLPQFFWYSGMVGAFVFLCFSLLIDSLVLLFRTMLVWVFAAGSPWVYGVAP